MSIIDWDEVRKQLSAIATAQAIMGTCDIDAPLNFIKGQVAAEVQHAVGGVEHLNVNVQAVLDKNDALKLQLQGCQQKMEEQHTELEQLRLGLALAQTPSAAEDYLHKVIGALVMSVGGEITIPRENFTDKIAAWVFDDGSNDPVVVRAQVLEGKQ